MVAFPRDPEPWPELPLAEWQDTYATLHRYTQVVGKVRLAFAPMMNQWWQAALHLSPRGLTTMAVPCGLRTFELEFDFFEHALVLRTSDGAVRKRPLGGSVRAFHADVLALLRAQGIDAAIDPTPQETAGDGPPLDRDEQHRTYDRAWAHRAWRILSQVAVVLGQYRAEWHGKSSPVHFFWGSFDLAVTRFSGRTAPPRPGADAVTRLAYDEEVASVGFWPGLAGVSDAAFYAYTVPKPDGFERARVGPSGATWSDALQEWLLPYEAVRRHPDPRAAILRFAHEAFAEGTRLAGWREADPAWRAQGWRPVVVWGEGVRGPAR